MAMTKAERERMEKLEHEARMARALRFPTDPCPVPMTEEEIKAACTVETATRHYSGTEKVAVGWFMNAFSGVVSKGCSDGYGHNPSGMGTTSRGMGRMYRTEAEAWRAMRHEKVLSVAAQLAEIDKAIEAAEKRAAEGEGQ